MGLVESLVLIAIGVAMIFLGRPNGPISRFLQVYIVGQLYVMTAMVIMVLGAAFFIANRPF
jgi:hypothetical protein